MRMPVQTIHRGMGWMPCIPAAISELNGEPIAQCNSISDQTPCYFDGPLANSGYCPSGMPGGLGTVDEPIRVDVTDCAPDLCFDYWFPWVGNRTQTPQGQSVYGRVLNGSCYCKPIFDVAPWNKPITFGLIGLIGLAIVMGGKRRR